MSGFEPCCWLAVSLCFRLLRPFGRASHHSGCDAFASSASLPQTLVGAALTSLRPVWLHRIMAQAFACPTLAGSPGGRPLPSTRSGDARPFRSSGGEPTPLPACASPGSLSRRRVWHRTRRRLASGDSRRAPACAPRSCAMSAARPMPNPARRPFTSPPHPTLSRQGLSNGSAPSACRQNAEPQCSIIRLNRWRISLPAGENFSSRQSVCQHSPGLFLALLG